MITDPTILPAGPAAASDGQPAPLRHVALLVESSGAYGRGLLQGIAKYNREHRGWSTYFQPHGLTDPPPDWLRNWKGDGILARINDRQTAKFVARTKVPVVNLRGTLLDLPFPLVTIDSDAIGLVAAEYLLDLGLVHFAVCGKTPGVNPALDERQATFVERIGEAGYPCPAFPAAKKNDWEAEQARLVEWLRALPRPVGIMACNDERGLQVLDACRRAGLAVPDEVAVLGVDNDEPLCDLSIPPMSSVHVNAEGIGYQAAALLDRMMSGGAPAEPVVRVPPRGVVARRSTDILACEDDEVSRAVRYIRERACRGLQVVDVLTHVGMSRASLQERMKRVIGRTIHQEIQRVRLTRVKQGLVDPTMTIKQVARDSGFSSVQYMTRLFHAVTGETPAQYRRQRLK